jgi:crotonobetaine/carnitine-CoA ligase
MLGSMVILLWTRERSPEEEIQTVVSVPAPPASLQGATEQRWGCTIESVYGLSDAPPLARSCPGVPLRPGSSGKILNGYLDVRILDDDAEPPTGQGRGEVVVRPQRPHVMFQGYYREPATTLGKFRNLWFHTCDLGQLDADDYFYFVNRKENYIRRRGEISSCEVETAIARHPAAPKAAIVGVTSDLIEQAFKTAVVLRDGGRLTHIEFTDESPRCGTSPLLDTFSSCQTYLAPPAERP